MSDNIEWALKRSDEVHEIAKRCGIAELSPAFREGFSLDGNMLSRLEAYGVDLSDDREVSAMFAFMRVLLDCATENGASAEATLGVLFDALVFNERSKR